MIYLGVDTAATISAAAAKKLKAEGVSFVGRYLVPTGMGKDLKLDEAKGLHDAGLAILLCWEIGAGDVKGGAERGRSDGARAKALAESFGVPAGTVIYFACDYCAVADEYPVIEAYIRAAAEACAPYEAGLYGHAGLVDYLAKQGACRRFWQCVAWSLGRLSNYTTVYQYQWSGGAEAVAMREKVGFSVDMNKTTSLTAASLWLPPAKELDDGEGGTVTEHTQLQPGPHWYDEAMAWAAEQGLINDGRPADPLTRAEAAVLLQRLDQRLARRVLEIIAAQKPEDQKNSTESGLLSD